ncbi:SDR family oxidoreductase [Sulfitobacter sp.]|uniref:SDR family oxidoreductase n=1 Tax=Sulfitobacter sp. TaxID=1903071 RepID=UPI003002D199
MRLGRVSQIEYQGIKEAFDINALGILRMVEAFEPYLNDASHPRILALTSLMGTIAKANSGSLGCRMSKAALNMAMHVVAAELAPRRITTARLRLDHVRTSMAGPNGAISASESAAAIMGVFDKISYQSKPRFLDLTGDPLSW